MKSRTFTALALDPSARAICRCRALPITPPPCLPILCVAPTVKAFINQEQQVPVSEIAAVLRRKLATKAPQ